MTRKASSDIERPRTGVRRERRGVQLPPGNWFAPAGRQGRSATHRLACPPNYLDSPDLDTRGRLAYVSLCTNEEFQRRRIASELRSQTSRRLSGNLDVDGASGYVTARDASPPCPDPDAVGPSCCPLRVAIDAESRLVHTNTIGEGSRPRLTLGFVILAAAAAPPGVGTAPRARRAPGAS